MASAIRLGPALLGRASRRAPQHTARSSGPRRLATTCLDLQHTAVESALLFAGLRFLPGLLKLGGGQKAAATGTAVKLATDRLGELARASGDDAKVPKLIASVVIDALGLASFLLPGLGETEDLAWAPISAILVQALYGSAALSAIDFAKEALPFSDVIPVACVGWALEYTPLGELPFAPKVGKRRDGGK